MLMQMFLCLLIWEFVVFRRCSLHGLFIQLHFHKQYDDDADGWSEMGEIKVHTFFI